MKRYTNPLDKIQIAAPCSADWNEMVGDERQRHCAECRLNVYNLSEMTGCEAENFLINAEGRVCLQFYRRGDGTVLTRNCPVGWQALKKRVSRTATAVFALVAGFFGGVCALESLKSLRTFTNYKKAPKILYKTKSADQTNVRGTTNNLPEIKSAIICNRGEFQ